MCRVKNMKLSADDGLIGQARLVARDVYTVLAKEASIILFTAKAACTVLQSMPGGLTHHDPYIGWKFIPATFPSASSEILVSIEPCSNFTSKMSIPPGPTDLNVTDCTEPS